MPPRESRGFASPQSSEIRNFVLSNRLGMVPDAVEDYLSIQAIAAILGREEQTIQKKLPKRLIERHPLGSYFRLSDAMKAMVNYGEGEEADTEAS